MVKQMTLQNNTDPPEVSGQAMPQASGTHWYTAGDNAMSWIREIGKHPGTPSYILERLSLSANADIRMAVGDHPNTSLEVLWLLSVDSDADVRYSLAENHNMNGEVLTALSLDTNPYVANRAERTLVRIRKH
jgi:hypothetical protein